MTVTPSPPRPRPRPPLTDSSGSGGDQVVPADCLLLAGSCIAEEAVLTGESTPQWKSNIGEGGRRAWVCVVGGGCVCVWGGGM